MKTFANGKLSFGLGAVNVAKRGVVSEPELVINPTVGAFRITPPVSRALGLANGDYVMFISTVAEVDKAIAERNPELVALCAENGIDINTPEGVAAIHAEFDEWGIAKGVQLFDAKGNPVMCKERMTIADKLLYVKNNFAAILESAIQNGDPNFAASLQAEGITEEQQIAMLAKTIDADEVEKYSGAKCANSSNLSGTGVALTFSDAAVWATLKADLGEAAKTVNRTFEVDVTELRTGIYHDGCKNVEVKVAMLGKYKDETPTRGRNVDASKKEAAVDEAAAE